MAKRSFTAEPHAPKYRQVLESLSKDILSGRYRAGQKLPSEAALVQQFRTSRITVGRALRDLAQRGLVDRVAGSGTYVRRGPGHRAGGPRGPTTVAVWGCLPRTSAAGRFSSRSAAASRPRPPPGG